VEIELITIYVVAEVVSLAIFDKRDLFELTADTADDGGCDFDVRLLRATADAVLLTDLTAF
jgi:hypothetical protein